MYFAAQLTEYNGEQQYTHDYLIKAASFEEAEKKIREMASTRYDGGVEDEGGTYYFLDGAIVIDVAILCRTTKKEFIEVLLKEVTIK